MEEKTGLPEVKATGGQNYDRTSELKSFDDTKVGVKGLADAGVTKVPRIFIQPPSVIAEISKTQNSSGFHVPVVDLNGIREDPVRRKEIIDQIRDASENWGFFQVINHSIPLPILEEMINGVKRFFEQDDELKKIWYTSDRSRAVVYNSNFGLYSSVAANWRDNMYCDMGPNVPDPQQLPEACRNILMDYSKHVTKLSYSLFELLSEALGLSPSHLNDMGCSEGIATLSNYYPACPQPELALAIARHADGDFITVLLQDHIGGLQVLHDNQWVGIPPVPGALVVNVGDLLQLISNDKFKSVEHRVLASKVGPRISVACFINTSLKPPSSKLYGPIKELLSRENLAKYSETTVTEYLAEYTKRGLGGTPPLLHFRL